MMDKFQARIALTVFLISACLWLAQPAPVLAAIETQQTKSKSNTTPAFVILIGPQGNAHFQVPEAIPLGPTGLGLYDLSANYNSISRKFALQGDLSTYPPTGRLLYLHGKLVLLLPARGLRFDGDLLFDGIPLAILSDVGISPQEWRGKIRIPGEPDSLGLDRLFKSEFGYRLNRRLFAARGELSLLGSFQTKTNLELLRRGRSVFETEDDLRLPGSYTRLALASIADRKSHTLELKTSMLASWHLLGSEHYFWVVLIGQNSWRHPLLVRVSRKW